LFNVDRLVAQTMSQRVFVDLFEMSASKVLVNGKACLPHRVTQGKNVGHGEGTTRGAKGTRIITFLCLMCFLWFLSAPFATNKRPSPAHQADATLFAGWHPREDYRSVYLLASLSE
jgi:hypothetical protein